jgi:hypothetical protein
MAFSSMSIEQITFEVDDTRCNDQKIKSSDSLVHYDYSEFPNQINDYSFNHENDKNINNKSIDSGDINNNNPYEENSNQPIITLITKSNTVNNQESESIIIISTLIWGLFFKSKLLSLTCFY